MVEEGDGNREQPERGRWVGYGQLAGILAVIAVALYFARAPGELEPGGSSDAAEEPPIPAVRVFQPSPTERALTVSLTGTVKLEQQTRVMSEVVGRVIRVAPSFSNGGWIEPGETFIQVDPTEFELRVEAAQAAVMAADAHLRLTRSNGAGEAALAGAEADLMGARTALKLAQLQLERTGISLPYGGRVMRSSVEVGQLVGPVDVAGPAAVLGVVYRPEAVEVDVPIEPRELAYLAPAVGRSGRIHTRSASYAAEVVRVSSVVAPNTRLASVFLKFSPAEEADSLPLPGTFVQVDITGPALQNVYLLPEAGVQERDSVWIVEGGVLKSFLPNGLRRTPEGWVVQAFDAGEGVVVSTLPGVREGLAVAATPIDAGTAR